MADAQRHTEAWRDKPWKQFQRVVFRLQKCIYRASMVPMTRATCTEEPYDSNRITYGSGTAGGGATRLLTVTPRFGVPVATERKTTLSAHHYL